MNRNQTTLGCDLFHALLGHPGTILVIDDEDSLRLAYRDELEVAES